MTMQDGRFLIGRGERTQTFDLSVPNRARYQLRHTPLGTKILYPISAQIKSRRRHNPLLLIG